MSDDLAAVRRLHDAANDPTYSSPRVRRADIQAVVRLVDAQAARLAAVEQDRDDFRDSTYEMLGELLAAHQITADPCPGGPCVANALLAIGHALTAAEAERDQQTASSTHECCECVEELRRTRDQARADAADAMLAHGLAVEALRHVEAACKRDLAAAERRATRVETFIATLRDEMHVQSDPYAREYGDRIDDTLKVWAVEKLA